MMFLFKPLASLRLTLVLLFLSLFLVFFGTMAQEPLGLYLAQDRFFHSAFVDLASMIAAIKKTLQMLHVYLPPASAAEVLSAPYIPVYPGGYLLGSLLVVNLIAAHFARFKMTRKKAGIFLVHAGLILLLVGQLCTDMVASESSMRLTEGQSSAYSESDRQTELVVIDTTAADRDKVVAIPDSRLSDGASFSVPDLPFALKVQRYYSNSRITNRTDAPTAPPATAGFGLQYAPVEMPRVTAMNQVDVPSLFLEVTAPSGPVGTFLVSEHIARPQRFTFQERTYELGLRRRRHYNDFSLTLLDFRHDKYPGTEMARNYSSEVRLQNPRTGENRQVLIYMNNPLRYQGLTFYQASFDPRDERVTILQVVRNPAWLTPYFACVVVGLGLALQFGIHLVGFIRRPPGSGAKAPAGTAPAV